MIAFNINKKRQETEHPVAAPATDRSPGVGVVRRQVRYRYALW